MANRHTEKAKALFKQETLRIEIAAKEGMATDYANLGGVYKIKGSKAKAKRYWQKIIELFKYLGSPNEKLVQGWLDNL